MEPTVRTDRTIPNKPDIVARDNKQGTCMLTGVAILETEMCSRKKRRRL